MEIIKFSLDYLTSIKYITRDTIIKTTERAYTSGTVVVQNNKLVIIDGELTCL